MAEILSNNKKINWYHPAFLMATWFGIGKIPFAPGTMGSIAAFPLFIISHFLLCFDKSELSFNYIYLLFLAVLFFIGQWASYIYMKKTATEDPSEIVIDEVVGQLLVWFVAFGAFAQSIGIYDIIYGSSSERSQIANIESLIELISIPSIVSGYIYILLPSYLLSFVLFRIFDIWKPFPIKWCDKNIKGGFGVMFDDILAAFYACIFLYGIIAIFFVYFIHPSPESKPNKDNQTEIVQ